ncbi:MAG: radical SAM protein, partial [Gemmatimonadetes bacterium]|nr:radical SAM protein [Gemmatimonadota bacterium]
MPHVGGVVEHVYVHAPFCARRCVYCDFAVEVVPRPAEEAWQDVVAAEWRQWRDRDVETSASLETLYVGGGTPSLLPVGALSAFARAIGIVQGQGSPREWTAEANPESFTRDVAREWTDAGVNRVSLGVQTFSAAALRWMGRLHDAEDVAEALDRARSAGIHNLSVDL